MIESDPVLTALMNLSPRNKDVKFASTETLRGNVTCRHYVGVVDAPVLLLMERLKDAGVPVSDVECSHDTDGAGGMQVAVLSSPTVVGVQKPAKGKEIPSSFAFLCLAVVVLYIFLICTYALGFWDMFSVSATGHTNTRCQSLACSILRCGGRVPLEPTREG